MEQGREGVERFAQWVRDRPVRSRHLLERGLAYGPRDMPSYYYALFKTVDGNMRAYVRAGGPAYDAGMRTNDVVEKIDGKYWWEYGTWCGVSEWDR